MKIITSGGRYLDIDAYAGIIAYAELLSLMGLQARAVSTAPLNQSIPAIVRSWPAPLTTIYSPNDRDKFTLVDVSEPKYFEDFVDLERVEEVIDHHPGLESYWQERIGDGMLIEHVGAACTQIFEQWEAAGIVDQISETSARLLMCGILDNTLNFGAEITTDRDKKAYEVLARYANLSDNWAAEYFSACQEEIVADIVQSTKDDTKLLTFKTFDQPMIIGQLAVWDAGDMAAAHFETFKRLSEQEPFWFMNIIGISDKRSHFVTDVPEVQTWLQKTLNVTFNGNVAVADRAWLRKEIMKVDIDKAA